MFSIYWNEAFCKWLEYGLQYYHICCCMCAFIFHFLQLTGHNVEYLTTSLVFFHFLFPFLFNQCPPSFLKITDFHISNCPIFPSASSGPSMPLHCLILASGATGDNYKIIFTSSANIPHFFLHCSWSYRYPRL